MDEVLLMNIVLTTGSFDLLHIGHINILRRAKSLGDFLIVGLSTDRFHLEKGKKLIFPYEERKQILEAIKYVDLVLPEDNFRADKIDICKMYYVDTFACGDDWINHENWLKEDKHCRDVVYFPRTPNIDSRSFK